MPARARTDRNAATRERILDAAERLFAENGLVAVSNRSIAEAAGQGNTAVVGYHFGAKTDLVRALARRHSEPIERARGAMVDRVAGASAATGGAGASAATGGDGAEGTVRDWVRCLVLPHTEHLATLGSPTWFARFAAQVMTDPVMREIMTEEALTSPALRRTVLGLDACLPTLPPRARRERDDGGRLLLVHMLAERERALADGTVTTRETWAETAEGLVDMLVGVWTAPVTKTS